MPDPRVLDFDDEVRMSSTAVCRRAPEPRVGVAGQMLHASDVATLGDGQWLNDQVQSRRAYRYVRWGSGGGGGWGLGLSAADCCCRRSSPSIWRFCTKSGTDARPVRVLAVVRFCFGNDPPPPCNVLGTLQLRGAGGLSFAGSFDLLPARPLPAARRRRGNRRSSGFGSARPRAAADQQQRGRQPGRGRCAMHTRTHAACTAACTCAHSASAATS